MSIKWKRVIVTIILGIFIGFLAAKVGIKGPGLCESSSSFIPESPCPGAVSTLNPIFWLPSGLFSTGYTTRMDYDNSNLNIYKGVYALNNR